MPTPKHVAYLRTYEKDGKTRIWLEGRRVSDAGFAVGASFAISYAKNEVEIRLLDPKSDTKGKKVHGKTRNGGAWPIIDIFNQALEESVGKATRLKAEFRNGLIRIVAAAVSARALARLERISGQGSSPAALLMGSIFHGLGVLDNAIHAGLKKGGAKAELAFAVEQDPSALDASLKNNPIWNGNSTAILGSVEDVNMDEISKIDVLTAGIPCQGASTQGITSLKLKAPEFHPAVGHMFLPFLRFVEAGDPSVILIENVPNYRNTIGFEMITRQLEHMGYELEVTELHGNDFGALESRTRMVAIARAKGLPPILETVKAAGAPKHSLGDILEQVASTSPLWKEYAHVFTKLARDATKPRNGFKLNVLKPEARSVPTIIKGYNTTKSWQPFLGRNEDSLMRKFTAIEHARIKGIPERLIAGLPETVAHGLLGQSVIHPVFAAVGEAIAKVLKQARRAPLELLAAA